MPRPRPRSCFLKPFASGEPTCNMKIDPKMFPTLEEKQHLERVLLANLKQEQSELQSLLNRVNDFWCYEDGVYRFYHQSFKVFDLQHATKEMADAFKKVAPEG